MTLQTDKSRELNLGADRALVSIIINNYNYATYLPAAIESALHQDHAFTEILVVDDGSTDNSPDIIARYASRVRPIYKCNGGQASALNAGFAACRGDIILFLDSDDVLLPSAVTHVVKAFENPSVSNVRWPMWIVDADGNRTGDMRPPKAPDEGDFRDQLLVRGPTNLPSSPTSGNAWSRGFLTQILPIPEDVRYYRSCADEYLFTLAPAFGRLRTIREPQSHYRLHGANVYSSRSFRERIRLELVHYDDHCQAISAALIRNGIPVDVAKWKEHSWFHRLDQAVADITRFVPEAATLVLVDGGTWDAGAFEGHRVRPFFQRGGQDWGPPADCAAAIAQLSALRSEQVEYLAIAWPCFWWFDEYPQFFQTLQRHSVCKMRNNAVAIYQLLPSITSMNDTPASFVNTSKCVNRA